MGRRCLGTMGCCARSTWVLLALWALVASFAVEAQEDLRRQRARNEWFYHCMGSNTAGRGNIWATLRGIGFIWDDPGDEGGFPIVPLAEARFEWGVLAYLSLIGESRVLSYFWDRHPQFGDIQLGAKITTPNNRDLRLNGFGIELRYKRGIIKDFRSVGGLRNARGYGFSPEGFQMGENSFEARLAFEQDYIALNSKLPLKLIANVGTRVPMDREFIEFSQYLLDVAFAFVATSFDVFAGFSYEGFFHNSVQPKMLGMVLPSRTARTDWEVAFTENPMYAVLGGRIRYPSGLTMSACVPLLLSSNVGSSRSLDEIYDFHDQVNEEVGLRDTAYAYYDEIVRGVDTPFDPWYTKWKVVAELSFPLRYRQTGAEMRRGFLLLKNRKKGTKINIDERLQGIQQKALDKAKQGSALSEEEKAAVEADKKNRLEEIRKRREKIKKQD